MDQPRKLIDYSSRPPIPELSARAEHLRNYDRIYAGGRGAPADEYGPEALERYLRVYEEAGADHVVIKARDLETTFGVKVSNDDVAEFCRRHGPRYLGFAGVDPNKGMEAVRDLHRAITVLGLRGLNLQCFEHKLPINDKLMYPLYAKCVELGVPVNIHCGMNFSTRSLMSYGQPHLLDEVMMHFPELRVCAAPPGFPWVNELIGVAWKHPNVWIGLVFVRPKHLATPHSGYEALAQYGGTLLQDRIIFGSGYPALPLQRSLDEIEALPLTDAVRGKWLHGNAAAFLGVT